jgi:hypothetical protein
MLGNLGVELGAAVVDDLMAEAGEHVAEAAGLLREGAPLDRADGVEVGHADEVDAHQATPVRRGALAGGR